MQESQDKIAELQKAWRGEAADLRQSLSQRDAELRSVRAAQAQAVDQVRALAACYGQQCQLLSVAFICIKPVIGRNNPSRLHACPHLAKVMEALPSCFTAAWCTPLLYYW